jgi:hypothetical protein
VNSIEFVNAAGKSLHELLYRHGVSALHKRGQGVFELSSGTLVAVGARWFVATAAHTFPDNPNQDFYFVSNNVKRYFEREGRLGIVSSGKDRSRDIGYLELNPQYAGPFLGHEPCPVEQLQPAGVGRRDRLVALFGHPTQFAGTPRTENSQGIIAKSVAMFTTPVPSAEWPTWPSGSDPLDVARDLVLEYPADDAFQIGTQEPVSLDSPIGFSGGGVWNLGVEPGELWLPARVTLSAIQSAWDKTQRYCRATQIIHWLRLVHQDYPDLRPLLELSCPALRAEIQ